MRFRSVWSDKCAAENSRNSIVCVLITSFRSSISSHSVEIIIRRREKHSRSREYRTKPRDTVNLKVNIGADQTRFYSDIFSEEFSEELSAVVKQKNKEFSSVIKAAMSVILKIDPSKKDIIISNNHNGITINNTNVLSKRKSTVVVDLFTLALRRLCVGNEHGK